MFKNLDFATSDHQINSIITVEQNRSIFSTMTYSDDLRGVVLRLWSEYGGIIIPFIVEVFVVSRSTVYQWIHDFQYHEKTCASHRRTPKVVPAMVPAHLEVAKKILDEFPLLYYSELTVLVNNTCDSHYDVEEIKYALHKEGYTDKKLDYRAREQSLPLRQVFMAALSQYVPSQLVFVDETHSSPEDLRRHYGKAIHGRPAYMYIPGTAHGEDNPVCGICALSLERMLVSHVYEGNVDAKIFLDVLNNEILPNMNPFPLPRSVLVMDNASVHDPLEIFAACNRKGILLHFLPPYSYDLNPLEFAFHGAKQYGRTTFRFSGSGELAGQLLESLQSVDNPNLIASYFQHAGYLLKD